MHLFDQTHLLTLIFCLTAVRSTGTYPSLDKMKEEHVGILHNGVITPYLAISSLYLWKMRCFIVDTDPISFDILCKP